MTENTFNNNNINDDDDSNESGSLGGPNSILSLNDSKFDMSEGGEQKSLYTTNEFKVILLGDSGVGKTSIFKRFINNEYNPYYMCTINTEFKAKIIRLDKFTNAKLKIWDTMGSEKFRSLTKQYFRQTNGVVLIFDLTEKSSFLNLEKWVEDIKNYAEENSEVVLVGNKCDLINKRAVLYEEGRDYAEKKGYPYIETSAKEGTNVLFVFEELTRNMSKHIFQAEEEEDIYTQKVQHISENREIERRVEKREGCC